MLINFIAGLEQFATGIFLIVFAIYYVVYKAKARKPNENHVQGANR